MVSQADLRDDWAVNLQKNFDEKSSIRSKYFKLASLTSFAGSSLAGSINSTTRQRQDSHELFGFRKMAKTYLWGSSSNKNEAHEYITAANSNIKKLNLDLIHPVSGTIIYFGNKAPKTGERSCKYVLPKKRKCDYTFTKILNDQQNAASAKSIKVELDDINAGKSIEHVDAVQAYLRDQISQPAPLIDKVHQPQILPHEGANDLEWNDSRIISLSNISTCTGLHSILSQVYGGPLERIHVLKDAQDNKSIKMVQLHFTTHEGAKRFMEYGSTHLFKVNGKHLVPEWAPPQLTRSISNFSFERTKDYVDSKRETGEGSFARRCVILKKNTTTKLRNCSRDNLSTSSLYPLDIKELRRDFETFGDIVEITPMISRKLCVSINYFDVRSAVGVIENYKKPNTYFNRKYYKDWSLGYGRDTTDRPCFKI